MCWDNLKDIGYLLTAVGGVTTFVIAVQSYLHTHRPYLGISNIDTMIDSSSNSVDLKISQKNFGVLPAAGVQSNSKIYVNKKIISERTGTDEFVLFPGQETHGHTKLNNVKPNDEIIIEYTLFYRIPFLYFYDRKFSTELKMKYNHETGRPSCFDGAII